MTAMTRRNFLVSSAAACLSAAVVSTSGVAFAATTLPYSEENWQQALASGRPVAVRFYETWCSNCTAQGKTLAMLVNQEPAFADYVVIEVPFGANRAFAADLGIRRRTSIAIVVDGEVVTHVTGATGRSTIHDLLQRGI